MLQETALGDLDTDVCRLISFITSSLTGWAFHSPGEAGLGLAGTLMHLNGPKFCRVLAGPGIFGPCRALVL